MIAQYTAAAIVSENKVLAHPAAVDSIPTSANQEDHVSMGTIGARKARTILLNLRRVLAIELLCAAQGLDLRTGYADISHSGHQEKLAPATASKGKSEKAVSTASPLSTHKRLKAGKGVEAALNYVRRHISHLDGDREMHLDLARAEAIIASGELLTAVEAALGPLD